MPFALVLFEGVRSAEPPSSSGMAAARWSSTAPLAERVAISLPLAMNSARAAAIASFPIDGQFSIVPALELGAELSCLPVSRLLPPRSGLERSDFVLWHLAPFYSAAGAGRGRGGADMVAPSAGPYRSRMTQN